MKKQLPTNLRIFQNLKPKEHNCAYILRYILRVNNLTFVTLFLIVTDNLEFPGDLKKIPEIFVYNFLRTVFMSPVTL